MKCKHVRILKPNTKPSIKQGRSTCFSERMHFGFDFEAFRMTDTPLMRNQRNRDQWLSIANFLQAQKPSPQFKRKPTAAQKARAMVAALVRPESKA